MPKRYSIPKYLQKRKIELIRRKIICRKYAYIFYRNAISKILPSQARKYYLRNLMRKSFSIWFDYWYEKSVGFKHTLRAEIHYKLNIQEKYFDLWHRFKNYRKVILIKRAVALLHYNKIKEKFELKLCFQKWKIFTKYRIVKKDRLNWAYGHFKSKHYPKILEPYLHRWIALAKVAEKSRRKLKEASHIYELKLSRKYFLLMKKYFIKRLDKKQKLNMARNYFHQRLLAYILDKWKQYVRSKLKSRTSSMLASVNYLFTLKKHYFKKLHANAIRGKFLKEVLKAIDNVVVRKSFQKWLSFTRRKQAEKRTYDFIMDKMRTKLKRMVLATLYRYARYKKDKRSKRDQQVENIIEHLKKSKIKYCFSKWIIYVKYKKNQNNKLVRAAKFAEKKLLEKHAIMWKKFIKYKSHRKEIHCKAVTHYDKYLLTTYFRVMLKSLEASRKFRTRIEDAKTLHRHNLIEESIRVIVLAGIERREQLFQENIEKISRELFIAQKYLRIWKGKTIYKPTRKKKVNPECFSECDSLYSNNDLFQMCFVLPGATNFQNLF